MPLDESDKVKATNIRVCVRVRPILPSDAPSSPVNGNPKRAWTNNMNGRKSLASDLEDSTSVVSRLTASTAATSTSGSVAWKILQDQVTLAPALGNNSASTSYTVDAAFGPQSNTMEIYHSCVEDLVRATVRQGFHSSILAYGQTNAGKTFTMMGHHPKTKGLSSPSSASVAASATSSASDGIIQLAIQQVFQSICEQSHTDPREYLVRVTFIEIYNETIHDLLATPFSPNTNNTSLHNGIRIFESKTEGVVLRGLQEEIVTSPQQVLELLQKGQKHRQVAATGINANSSRSHTVFRLVIESSSTKQHGHVRVSSLSLVDLAGSECAKQAVVSQNGGGGGASMDVRQREGQYINKSLLTLGHVIYKLSEMNTRTGGAGTGTTGEDASTAIQNHAHIPYRDSKLTRILQPSLSGNAQVCIICLISPLVKNMEESHNTLKFACRAKRIRQHATVNEVQSLPTLLQNYQDEIKDLKEQLRQAKEAQLFMQRARENPYSPSNTTMDSPNMMTKYNGDVNVSEEGDDEDIQVLVQAIHNLEDLIIKTSTQSRSRDNSPGRQIILDGMESVISSSNNPIQIEKLHDVTKAGEKLAYLSLECDYDSVDSTMVITQPHTKHVPSPRQNKGETSDSQSSIRPSIQKITSHDDESLSSHDEDNSTIQSSNFIAELHRTQELLATILRRKEMNSFSSKVSVLSPRNPEIHNIDTEVSRLKTQLEEQTLAGSMRKADLSFLEYQLSQKDALLADISGILESVEARQRQLEKDNVRMKKELLQVKDALKEKESELQELRKTL